MNTVVRVVNVEQCLARIEERWQPHVVGELNGQHVRLAKLRGQFIWHRHDDEDELFLVLHGRLTIRLRDGEVHLAPGEFCIVPRGTEHLPVADEDVHVMLFEPASTRNTGDVDDQRTIDKPKRL